MRNKNDFMLWIFKKNESCRGFKTNHEFYSSFSNQFLYRLEDSYFETFF